MSQCTQPLHSSLTMSTMATVRTGSGVRVRMPRPSHFRATHPAYPLSCAGSWCGNYMRTEGRETRTSDKDVAKGAHHDTRRAVKLGELGKPVAKALLTTPGDGLDYLP
jgi:hypothetical protein